MLKKAVMSAILLALAATTALAKVGGGDITMKNKGGDVVFSHEGHVDGGGLDCRSCHAGLYLSSGQHKHVSMKEMRKGKSCGACHNGKKAFSVKGDCAKCHKK